MMGINFTKLIFNVLPTLLRGNLAWFIRTLIYPICRVYWLFMDFRDKQKTALSYNSQYPNLQRLLNDKFDNILRRIKIYDGNFQTPLIIYPTADQIEVITPIMIYPAYYYSYPPFIVELPSIFQNDQNKINQINKIVNIYKFLGTFFTIIYV